MSQKFSNNLLAKCVFYILDTDNVDYTGLQGKIKEHGGKGNAK